MPHQGRHPYFDVDKFKSTLMVGSDIADTKLLVSSESGIIAGTGTLERIAILLVGLATAAVPCLAVSWDEFSEVSFALAFAFVFPMKAFLVTIFPIVMCRDSGEKR